jgi:predicted phosphodiesterase
MRKLIRYLFLRPIRWLAIRLSSNPDRTRVFEALSKLQVKIKTSQGKKGMVLPLDSANSRFIIFSDQHKGAKNGADDFQLAEPNYIAALNHYYSNNFHLICLGDSEELWENTLAQVKKHNRDSFEAEKQFLSRHAFTKIFGNHDLEWEINPLAGNELRGIYDDDIVALEGIILEGTISGKALCIFCTHGHQGDEQSDGNLFSKFFISKIWAPLQAYLHINPNTPAYDVALKTEHNKVMYEWSSEQKGMLLITGHTHQPVFESFTHFERLQRQKDNNLYKDIKPSYFNTGCCCFDDGDVTGIEIVNGYINLIKWESTNGIATRIELESTTLEKLADKLNEPSVPIAKPFVTTGNL